LSGLPQEWTEGEKVDVLVQTKEKNLDEKREGGGGGGRRERRRGRKYIIAVHVGAGYHSPAKESLFLSAMSEACEAARCVLTGDDYGGTGPLRGRPSHDERNLSGEREADDTDARGRALGRKRMCGNEKAVEAVKCAIAKLEDCPQTNAGIGSNLSLSGSVWILFASFSSLLT
jgi:hypothetical protein